MLKKFKALFFIILNHFDGDVDIVFMTELPHTLNLVKDTYNIIQTYGLDEIHVTAIAQHLRYIYLFQFFYSYAVPLHQRLQA